MIHEAFRSLLRQCMKQENIPSDFFSCEVQNLIDTLKNKHFPAFRQTSLFDPILLINAALKHNKTRALFLKKLVAFKTMSAQSIRRALKLACKAHGNLDSSLQLNITDQLKVIHGPKKTEDIYGPSGRIEEAARSGIGISELAYIGIEPRNGYEMAELCRKLCMKLNEFSEAHNELQISKSIPNDDRYYYYYNKNYNAPWTVCSIFVQCGIQVKIDGDITWEHLGLVESKPFGGLGVLKDSNLNNPEAKKLLSYLHMIRPVDFIKSGLSDIHPRELSMYICLCKGNLGSALTCLDKGEDFILSSVEPTQHVMKDSIVGVLSDMPPCRTMSP